jgi:hypothetical protein
VRQHSALGGRRQVDPAPQPNVTPWQLVAGFGTKISPHPGNEAGERPYRQFPEISFGAQFVKHPRNIRAKFLKNGVRSSNVPQNLAK